MIPVRMTVNTAANEQLLYFTSSSLSADDEILWLSATGRAIPMFFAGI